MGRHSDSSSESSDSDDSRRRRREKRGKKDKDKKSKRDKHSKKDKHGKRSKRSRTPERPKTLGLSTALQDIDIDKALEQDEQEIFRQALEQQKRRQPAAELGANNHNNQLIVTNADGTLTLAGSTALIAPDANSEKIRAYAQVARESRRVHVSHIPRGMDQDQLRQMFGVWCSQIRRQMIEMDVGRRLPEECVVDVDEVVDVYLNTRGAIPFAFIELTTDDMCTKLITGDLPVEFPLANGGTTKVGCRRPRDYRPMMQVDPSRVMMLGMSNPEASLSTFKQLFETLGEVKVFAVIPKRGYYVEYANAKSGEAACKALHGEVIGDRVIVVQPTTEAIRAWFLSLDLPVSGLFDEITSGLSGDIRKDVMGELLNLQIPLPQAIDTYIQIHEHLKLSWPMILPTRILCIFNAFDRAELDETDDSYDNLVLDIEEEVEKHGRVKRLIVPRELPKPPMPPDEYVPPKKPVPTPVFNSATTMPSFYPPDEGSALIDPTGMSDAAYQIELVRWQAEVDEGNKQYQRDYDAYLRARAKWDLDCMHPVFGTPGLGRCYVEYETVDEAAAAQAAIAGRLFGGRTVVTSFLFEDVLYPPPEDEEEDVTSRGGDDVKDAPAPSDEPSTAPATSGAAEGTTHNNAADDID